MDKEPLALGYDDWRGAEGDCFDYWRELCPALHITPGPPSAHQPTLSDQVVSELQQRMDQDGYFTLDPEQLGVKTEQVSLLADGVMRLKKHGWPATFIILYDEALKIAECFGAAVTQVTGNRPLMDVHASCVDPRQGQVLRR